MEVETNVFFLYFLYTFIPSILSLGPEMSSLVLLSLIVAIVVVLFLSHNFTYHLIVLFSVQMPHMHSRFESSNIKRGRFQRGAIRERTTSFSLLDKKK